MAKARPAKGDIKQHAEVVALRTMIIRLQRQLREAKGRVEDLVAATYEGARDGYLVVPRTELRRAPLSTSRGKPEVALWHLTDWQGGKRTPSYNSTVMRKRVQLFWDKAEKITAIQRKDHPVDQCVILFGGDMVEGLFNFPSQVHEIDSTLHMQWETVSQLVIETIERALQIYRYVRVVAEWGNHGKIGHHRDGVPRHDNIDRMVYTHARARLQERKLGGALIWEDSAEDIQRVQIGDYRALLIHGDEIGRRGYASPMTIVAWVVRQKSGAYPWPFRDVYMGHYHTHAEWPLPDGAGAVYQSGSTESSNRYAGVFMAAQATPSQRLHFIDPAKGRVASQYKVFLE